MSRYVVGASVAIKWYVPEVLSEAAAKLLSGDLVLMAPDLAIIEIGALLYKKLERGEINSIEARDILSAFKQVPMEKLSSADYMELAFEIAEDHDLDFYDSLYIATAIRTGCPVVTADEDLYRVMSDGPYSKNIVWVEDIP